MIMRIGGSLIESVLEETLKEILESTKGESCKGCGGTHNCCHGGHSHHGGSLEMELDFGFDCSNVKKITFDSLPNIVFLLDTDLEMNTPEFSKAVFDMVGWALQEGLSGKRRLCGKQKMQITLFEDLSEEEKDAVYNVVDGNDKAFYSMGESEGFFWVYNKVNNNK